MAAAAAAVPAAGPAPRTVLVVGDSLSAGYGLPRDAGWVHLLAERTGSTHAEYSVVNASISGETSQGGRSRIARLLGQWHPAIVVLELGANDGLRGLDLGQMQANLQAIVDACRGAGARVVLVGMRIPPNYGEAYTERFARVFDSLAHANRVAYVPFLLDGFADRLDFFQADRIHPDAEAQAGMMENVWRALEPALGARGGKGGPAER